MTRLRMLVLLIVSVNSAEAQVLPANATPIVPRLSLSIQEHDDPLWQSTFVRDMKVDSRGNIYVFEDSDFSVRMFSATGRRVKRLGGRGAGPGEFTQAARLKVLRDTLWVIEGFTNRVSGFALKQPGQRTFVVPQFVGLSTVSMSSVAAGGLLVTRKPRTSNSMSFATGDSWFAYSDMSGRPLNNLAPIPNVRMLVVETRSPGSSKTTGRLISRQPFLDLPRMTLTYDGKNFLHVSTSSRSILGGGAINITLLELHGDTAWKRALRYTPKPVTAADLDHVLDSLMRPRPLRGGAHLTIDRRMLEDSLIRTSHWPPVTLVLSGTDGTIWMQQGGPNTAKARFWRLSPTGDYEATVEMPRGFHLMVASRQYLWGWREDADGLPIIERYEM